MTFGLVLLVQLFTGNSLLPSALPENCILEKVTASAVVQKYLCICHARKFRRSVVSPPQPRYREEFRSVWAF